MLKRLPIQFRAMVGSARQIPLAAHGARCPVVGLKLETGQLSRHHLAEISLNVTLNHGQPTSYYRDIGVVSRYWVESIWKHSWIRQNIGFVLVSDQHDISVVFNYFYAQQIQFFFFVCVCVNTS